MRTTIRWLHICGAALSGVLLVVAFPKFDVEWLAWISLVPLLVALKEKGLKEAFLLSYVTGFLFINGLFYWIWTVHAYNLVDYVLLEVVYLPAYVALWGLGIAWFSRTANMPAWIVGPPLWIVLEYGRAHLSFLSFPWMLLGHSQYLQTPLVQVSSMTGVYGLSFIIVLMNTSIAAAVPAAPSLAHWTRMGHIFIPYRRQALRVLLIAALLVGGSYIYGKIVLFERPESKTAEIGVVQGNTPLGHAWDTATRLAILEQHGRLTRAIAESRPSLIVWPESAVPGDVKHQQPLRDVVGRLAQETGVSLLVGSSEYAKFSGNAQANKYYNSMYLISPEGDIQGQYRKTRLVPFGETPPLRGVITWPTFIASSMGDTLPGDHYTIFRSQDRSFGVVICWENIFPELFSEFVKRGAEFMVSATNESWFGDTAAPYQLLAMTAFRAAENRIPIVRAANTGISAFIDEFGRVEGRVAQEGKEVFVEGALSKKIQLRHLTTFYTSYGDIFAYSQIALFTILLLLAILKSSLFVLSLSKEHAAGEGYDATS